LNRQTRYQGAIVRDYHILLIKHCEHKRGRTYWIFPCGGIEPGETEEECVKREMKEETDLDVKVKELLLDEPAPPESRIYQRARTYLCEPLSDDAKPGYEPEPEVASVYSIEEVKWFDLRNESTWDSLLVNDPLTYLPLQRLRRKVGYLPKTI
jgi:8-oxo-dGTP pyrophosphatase MutT (NUDIX family)